MSALNEFISETKQYFLNQSSSEITRRVEQIVTCAYQASLRQDELRRISFRLAYLDIISIDSNLIDAPTLQPVIFSVARPFNAHELRKLAPAVGFSRTVIVIWPNEQGELLITGILYTGAKWLRGIQGGRGAELLIPNAFIVHVLAPGCLESRYGALILSQLKFGATVVHSLDIFESQWLPSRFKHVREELLGKFEATISEDRAKIDPSFFGKLSQQMIKRLIAAIQGNRHGGAIILASIETINSAVSDGILNLKQSFLQTSATTRHKTLMLRAADLMTTLGSNLTSRNVGWDEYVQMSHEALNALDEALFDEAYLIGGLAGADGSVVLSDRFELIGFGGEIAANDINITEVKKSLDLEGLNTIPEITDNFGTRHRSAFRFSKKYPDAISIVISQDGDVRFITNKDDNILIFEHEASLVVELVL